MDNHTEELRKHYINHPAEGMSVADIRGISDEQLLDMDCFLNEDDFEDAVCAEGFYIF